MTGPARTTRPRITALLAVLCAVLFALSLGAPAQAAPYTAAATLGVSESNPCQHGTVTLTGSGYTPGSTVTLTIGGAVLGRVTVGSDGTFSTKVTLPATLTGARTITATGSRDGRTASTRITIKACGDGAGAGGAHNGGGAGGGGDTGGLSATGVAVITLLIVAVVLIGAGLVLVFGGRRRRTSATV